MSNGATPNWRVDDLPVRVFSTCPASGSEVPASYCRRVSDVARWSERAGCQGILVYSDNGLIDPWLVAQVIVEQTDRLSPLVAVQPVYMHPYAVAKIVSSFGYLYRRRVALNMIAGGFRNDLAALNDLVPHDRRYDRLVEYTSIVKRLLLGGAPLQFDGAFYQVKDLVLKPPLPPDLMPMILVSGSSEAGLSAARTLGAVAVQYPPPPNELVAATGDARVVELGLRVGIIARRQESEAWEAAHARFPEDRRGQITHQLAMKVSDSAWHKQLSSLAKDAEAGREGYWLGPFQNYKTFCPYLVGSYGRVADLLERYIRAGFRTYILDIPPSEEELVHIGISFRAACEALRDDAFVAGIGDR